MTATAPVLPVVEVALAEIAYITVTVHPFKLGSVLNAHRASVALPPIWLSRSSPTAAWALQDGNHRIHAARMLGHVTIRAVTATGADQIATGEYLWSIGAIGVSDSDARSAVRRHREALARCGLAHLFPDLTETRQ